VIVNIVAVLSFTPAAKAVKSHHLKVSSFTAETTIFAVLAPHHDLWKGIAVSQSFRHKGCPTVLGKGSGRISVD
jgi:hypothetical protein